MKIIPTVAAASLVLMTGAWAQDAKFVDADPIVFVHGDSDTAALWQTQIWRFESNGYPRDKLIAIDLDNPGARGDNTIPEVNRSSTFDVATQVKRDVAGILGDDKEAKVDMVGNSRGCQTIRNYLRNFGGAAKVDTAVLTGCVHKGVFMNPGGALGSEYNGLGYFLTGLNEGREVEEGVNTHTIRSDKFDLYNQPMGDFIGFPGTPIGGRFDGPELEGATNHVIDGADHRETAYSPEAFAIMFEAITGEKPATTEITPEEAPVLNGEISGWENDRPTNRPLSGAMVRVYKTDPATGERVGEAVHEKTVGDDGQWGPFTADPNQTYEFEITADGLPVHHIYRSPFPRSSNYVNLRIYPKEGAATESKSHVSMMRPRGYYGIQDTLTFNGEQAPGLNDNEVPNSWKVHAVRDGTEAETVVGGFNGETIAARTWPSEGHTAWIELTN